MQKGERDRKIREIKLTELERGIVKTFDRLISHVSVGLVDDQRHDRPKGDEANQIIKDYLRLRGTGYDHNEAVSRLALFAWRDERTIKDIVEHVAQVVTCSRPIYLCEYEVAPVPGGSTYLSHHQDKVPIDAYFKWTGGTSGIVQVRDLTRSKVVYGTDDHTSGPCGHLVVLFGAGCQPGEVGEGNGHDHQ
jgi:hypothetical protein